MDVCVSAPSTRRSDRSTLAIVIAVRCVTGFDIWVDILKPSINSVEIGDVFTSIEKVVLGLVPQHDNRLEIGVIF